MRSHSSMLTFLAAVAVAGCAETATTLAAPDVPLEAREPANPGAVWELYGVLSDGTAAAITGDGRDASGSGAAEGSTGAYGGGSCGVRTVIFVGASASGDATIDPDADYNNRTKCTRRSFSFAIDGSSLAIGAFTNARNVWYDERLASPGDQKLERMQWHVDLPGCYQIRFENVRITRLPDINGKRVWTVETTDPTAVCRDLVGGTWVEYPDRTYELPYSLKITQM